MRADMFLLEPGPASNAYGNQEDMLYLHFTEGHLLVLQPTPEDSIKLSSPVSEPESEPASATAAEAVREVRPDNLRPCNCTPDGGDHKCVATFQNPTSC